jgi:UDP-glucose 4-epimerase
VRVLVTGGAGFIGSHLADRLAADRNDVMAIDNFLTGRHTNYPRVHRLDVRNRQDLYQAANHFEPDLIIHCAASYSDPNLWHRDAETNVLGTINTTLAAKHHGARLFYFNTALPPINSYAISKVAGGQYIEQSGVDHVTFRLSNIYGPRNLSGPIPTFYKRLSAGEACTVTDTRRDMVYIADLVRAVMAAIDHPQVTGVVDICSGHTHPIYELYNAVVDATCDESRPVEVTAAARGDVKQMTLDPARAALDLNWLPSTDLIDGVRNAVAWYREHGVTDTYTHLTMPERTKVG